MVLQCWMTETVSIRLAEVRAPEPASVGTCQDLNKIVSRGLHAWRRFTVRAMSTSGQSLFAKSPLVVVYATLLPSKSFTRCWLRGLCHGHWLIDARGLAAGARPAHRRS